MMESSQLAADKQQGVEEEKEMSEGDNEEVYNILNTPDGVQHVILDSHTNCYVGLTETLDR